MFEEALAEHLRTMRSLSSLLPTVRTIGETLIDSLTDGGKIIWAGNGGSAADAQHLAAELVGRFAGERRGLASIALTTDTSILTAVANDYRFEDIFSRQIQALASKPDVFLGLSTSGNSANVVNAMEMAAQLGLTTVAMTGRCGGQLENLAQFSLRVPSDSTARIQEAHIFLGHLLCQQVDHHFTEFEH